MEEKSSVAKAGVDADNDYDDYGIQLGSYRDNLGLMTEARALWDAIPSSQHQAEEEQMWAAWAEETASVGYDSSSTGS